MRAAGRLPRDGREILMREKLEKQGWFITSREIDWLAANMPMLPCLIRRGNGREVVKAAEVNARVAACDHSVGNTDYIRDVSTWPEDFCAYGSSVCPHSFMIGRSM